MKHGTLSNEVEGRITVLWEGTLAFLPDKAAHRKFRTLDRMGSRRRALEQWETIPIARASLTDLAYRRSVPVDLATFLDAGYVPKLRERARREGLPITEVNAYTEDSLDEYARHTPFVVRVIHPYMDRPFLFGGKGVPVQAGRAWSLW